MNWCVCRFDWPTFVVWANLLFFGFAILHKIRVFPYQFFEFTRYLFYDGVTIAIFKLIITANQTNNTPFVVPCQHENERSNCPTNPFIEHVNFMCSTRLSVWITMWIIKLYRLPWVSFLLVFVSVCHQPLFNIVFIKPFDKNRFTIDWPARQSKKRRNQQTSSTQLAKTRTKLLNININDLRYSLSKWISFFFGSEIAKLHSFNKHKSTPPAAAAVGAETGNMKSTKNPAWNRNSFKFQFIYFRLR